MGQAMFLGPLAFALGALGAFWASRWGWRLGLVDRPSARSSHSRPTPKGGGIGIAAAFLLSAAWLGLPAPFWLPLGLLAGLSFRNDQVEIPPKLRLSAQFVLAGIMVVATGLGRGEGVPGIPILLLSIVFIVGTANFYNFMDGINGIAAISGAIGFGFLAAVVGGSQPAIGLLSACIALACLGFLPFNLPRARVFMGDVGSILLGSAFAGLVFLASRSLLDFICLGSFLFPFYADELTTMTVRLRCGESLTQPHRRHIYQLLANERKIAHWRVSLAYGLLQLLVGGSVLASRSHGLVAVAAVLAGWFALFVAGGVVIRRKGV